MLTSYISLVIKDVSLLETQDYADFCTQLREKAQTEELLFGEVFLLIAQERKARITERSFKVCWAPVHRFSSIADKHVCEVTDELLKNLWNELYSNQLRLARQWVRLVMNSVYNIRKWGLNGCFITPIHELDYEKDCRSEEERKRLIRYAVHDDNNLDAPVIRALQNDLAVKSLTEELSLGEVILLLTNEFRSRVEPVYFHTMWKKLDVLVPLLDLHLSEITDEMLQEICGNYSANRVYFAREWISLAGKSPYNTARWNGQYRMAANRAFVNEQEEQAEKCCHPFVVRIVMDRRLFQSEELKICCDDLARKHESGELLFGEAVLLLACEIRQSVTERYFGMRWRTVQAMLPVLNLYIWEITDEMVESMQGCVQDFKMAYIGQWVKIARFSTYNSKRAERDYSLGLKSKNIGYISQHRILFNSISFPDDYELPRYARFETVFKYWVWVNKDSYTENTMFCNKFVAFDHLEPIHRMPYRNIRPDDVLTCLGGLSRVSKCVAITLYHNLDLLAYEKNLIPKLYSNNLKADWPAYNMEVDIPQSEIDTLAKNCGSIEIDVTLVLLYTGFTPQEVCLLRPEDIDGRYIHVPNDRNWYLGRDVPVHPRIEKCLQHVAKYMEERDTQHVEESRRAATINKMVQKATEKYCHMRYSPSDCRRSFAARMMDAGAGRVITERVMGITGWDCGRIYVHPSSDRIYDAVLRTL